MTKLKDILDEWGWHKVQKGERPLELKPEPYNSVPRMHQYDLYALKGVCAIAEDGKNIVQLLGIEKVSEEYKIKFKLIPDLYNITTQNAAEFLEGFRNLHSFTNRFLFVKEEKMHFDGIGKRLEEAGELCSS